MMVIDTAISTSIFNDLADFIVSQPSLNTIIEYRVPEAIDQRIHELLEKNRESNLTADEREEMNNYLAMSHLMTLAKARLRQAGKA